MKTHLPLRQALSFRRNVCRRQQSRWALGIDHHGGRNPPHRRRWSTGNGIKRLDSRQTDVLLLRAVVDHCRQRLRRRVKLRRRYDLAESASRICEVTTVRVPGPSAPCLISNAANGVTTRPPRGRGRRGGKQAGARRTKRGGIRGVVGTRSENGPAEVARPMRRLEGIHTRRHTKPPSRGSRAGRVHGMTARVRGGR